LIEKKQRQGFTVVHLIVDQKIETIFCIADPIKDGSKTAIETLHRLGLEVVMLSGDNQLTAESVAKELNIDQFIGGILPEGKVKQIKSLQSEGKIVAMAGDGINDAPALAQANVGIAMGTGTDVAIESAQLTLVKGDLRGIIAIRKISVETIKNIRQNLWLAFGYNTVGVPIAAGILYPFFGLLLSPIIASAAMSFSSVSVIANALRLRRIKLQN
ncbi:MAG: HAD-IC family P-type ATPase, partial [Calditrichaeota bacterium]|nr:HAD-IC family P-type ATPase [Calditrichota bacterium]